MTSSTFFFKENNLQSNKKGAKKYICNWDTWLKKEQQCVFLITFTFDSRGCYTVKQSLQVWKFKRKWFCATLSVFIFAFGPSTKDSHNCTVKSIFADEHDQNS